MPVALWAVKYTETEFFI